MRVLNLPFAFLAIANAVAAPSVTPATPKLVDGCYQIGTAAELYGFAEIVNDTNNAAHDNCACGKLTADIKVNHTNVLGENDTLNNYYPWTPIMDFCGTFDGNGKTISGLYISNGTGPLGLFGSTQSKYISYEEQYKATIKNVGVVNTYLYADTCIGVLVGSAKDVDIINCHTGGSVYGRYGIGGMVGCMNRSTITHSYNTTIGNGKAAAGSLVGKSYNNNRITNSYNKGKVSFGCSSCSSEGDPIGFVGQTSGFTLVENSYHMPTVVSNKEKFSLLAEEYGSIDALNSFYNGNYTGKYGTHVTNREFNDGTVAKLLHEYKSDSTKTDGSVWGQNVGVDESPVFVDKLVFSSTIVPKAPKQTNGCYQIGTAEELFGFANIVNASLYNIVPFCAELTSDIVLNKDVQANKKGSIEWIPIRDFDGSFDGQGYTISGLYFNDTTVTNAGLFASINNQNALSPAVVKNLKIADAYLQGGWNTGALVGEVDTLSKKVSIENCEVDAIVGNTYINQATQYRGGLVALHHGGTLTLKQTSSEVHLYGQGQGGGLVGYVMGELNIINSYSVASDDYNIQFGGLVGYAPQPYYVGTTLISAQINIENSYGLTKSTDGSQWIFNPLIRVPVPVTYKNSFHLENSNPSIDSVGFFSATEEQFKNGSVAYALHLYKSETADGSVWGQKVGTDKYPKLTGSISGANVKISALKFVTFDGDTAKYIDKYVEGIETALPITERKDYVFKGWFSNKDFSGSPVKVIPKNATGDQTYYAKWWHVPSVVNNCYEIGNIGELRQFADLYNSEKKHTSTCVKLTADITDNKNVLVNGKINEADSATFEKWTPIKNFIGTFDGQGHTISGLFFSSLADGVGLFGSVGLKRELGEKAPVTSTVVKDIDIKDSYFYGNKYVGSLIGYAESAANLSIVNVSSESNINANSNHAGGIIGYYGNDEGPDEGIELNIVNVHHDGETFGYNCVGGIAGSILYAKSTIINVSNTGATLGYGGIGGLVGQIVSYDTSKSTMKYSYNEGFVGSTNATAGGLVAFQKYFLDLYNSYNVGNVQAGTFKSGGIIGQTDGYLTIVNTYNKGVVSAAKDSLVDALIAETGKNSELALNNAFYVQTASTVRSGTAAADKEFTDLSLAKKLHDYNKNGINGDGWGQDAGDAYPHFKKDVVEKFATDYIKTLNLETTSSSSVIASSSSRHSGQDPESSSSKDGGSSSAMTKSSSSSTKASSSSTRTTSSSWSGAIGSSSSSRHSGQDPESSSSKDGGSSSAMTKSSSSAKSSSSVVKSSSSSVKSSSSKAKSSSSSVKSSSSKAKSSSSKGSALENIKTLAELRITVEPSVIAIRGATVGSDVVLMDLQGRILYSKYAPSSDFSISKPNPGTYVLRIMNQKQVIVIR